MTIELTVDGKLQDTQTIEKFETIDLDITNDDFLLIAKAAHLENMSINQFVEKACIEALKKVDVNAEG